MPTYRNDGSSYVPVYDTTWCRQMLAPGGTIETYYFHDNQNLTKTADSPRYNPVVAACDVTSTGAEITVLGTAKAVEVINTSTSVTVSIYLGASTNTPAITVPPGSYRVINDLQNLARTLVVSFSGSLSANELLVQQWDRNL